MQPLVFGTFDPNVIYQERVAAYVVIRSSDGGIAAVQGRTAFFLPGGGREGNETPEQTIRREVQEELGRGLHRLAYLGNAIQYFFAASDNRHFKMHADFFTAEFTDAEPSNSENTLHWLPEDIAPSHFFHACHAWAVTAK